MLPEDFGTHTLFVGTTGGGKTLAMRLLQQSTIPIVGTGQGYRALVYDAKQDAMPILSAMIKDRSRIKLMNPFDSRSVSWDIQRDVTRSSVAMEIAHTLFPDVADNNSFFQEAARLCAWGVMCSYILSELDWSFADLMRGMLNPQTCKRILCRHAETGIVVDLLFQRENLVGDIFATIASKAKLYWPVAASWETAKEKLAISECMNEEYVVVLGNTEVNRATINAINAVLFKRWTDYILTQPDDTQNDGKNPPKRFWTFIDELSEAGPLPGFPSFAKRARSKGGRLAVATQSVQGLRDPKLYGEKVTDDFLSSFGNRMVMRLNCVPTAELMSSYLGDFEDFEESSTSSSSTTSGSGPNSSSSTTHSGSTSKSLKIKRTILPSELTNMKISDRFNGLVAFYSTQVTYPCWAAIPPNVLFQELLLPLASDVANFEPKDAKTEFLRPWPEEVALKFAPPIEQSIEDRNKPILNKSVEATSIDKFIP
jgi:type IV secretory pathway TraG/TraD family ATPase VirD4